MVKTKLKHQAGIQLNFNARLSSTPLHADIIFPGMKEYAQFLLDWKTSSYFVLDLETAETKTGNGLDARRGKIRLFQILLPNNKLLIVDTLRTTHGLEETSRTAHGLEVSSSPVSSSPVSSFIETLRQTCSDPQILVVGHNLYFDLTWLRVKYSIVAQCVRDTKVLAQVATAGIKTQRYSLAAVHKWLFEEELDKTLQTSDWNQPDLSNEQYNYARLDVIATHRCFLRLCAIIKKYDKVPDVFGRRCDRTLVEVAQIECDSIPAFVEMGVNGYPVNLSVIAELIAEYEQAIADLYDPVQKKLGLPYSAQAIQLAKAIYDVYSIWLLREKTTKELEAEEDKNEIVNVSELNLFNHNYPNVPETHVLTTASATLFSYYLKTENDDLLIISLTRSLKKLLDTLYALRDSAWQNNGRAVTRFNSLGSTSSGRSTSSGDNSSTTIALNLQNLPNPVSHPLLDKYKLKPIRYAIQAPTGKKLSIIDLSASHSRLCAKLSGDRTLVATLSESDPHLTGSVVLMNRLTGSSLTLAEAKARGGKKDEELNGYRSLFKVFYYLSLNVGSPTRLLTVLNKDFKTATLDVAQACAETFKETFPQVVKWQRMLHQHSIKTIVPVKVELKSGKKYTQKYSQFRTTDGRLMHLPVFKVKNFNGKGFKKDAQTGDYLYQPSISECTSVSFISPEALLMKRSLIETMRLQTSERTAHGLEETSSPVSSSPVSSLGQHFKLIGMCHDEFVLELDGNEFGVQAAKEVYNIIAMNFQAELGSIPSGMDVSDENVLATLADRYDQK
ncbi:MAG: hypothetical protein RLZZ171_2600 [Cyanobacteriota bacterium]